VDFRAELAAELDRLREEGLLRTPLVRTSPQGPRVKVGDREYISFSSNDYLGLATHPSVVESAMRMLSLAGVGSGASRLVSGTHQVHQDLESRIAGFEGCEDAVLFPSGYAANVGTIPVLVGKGDAVVCDALDHASLFEGARLSGARLLAYAHRDMASLAKMLDRAAPRYRRLLVVTDGVFSMDGDIAPLDELVPICRERGAWVMVDEAHATGVLGGRGHGACEYCGVSGDVQVVMGTLSKAFGTIGGFVAGAAELCDLLRNKAKSYIYTTAPPPAVCAAAIAAIDLVERDQARRKILLERAQQLRMVLEELGYDLGASTTQIIPLMRGEVDRAVELAAFLRERGIIVPAIRPPSVPKGGSRLRISLTSTHSSVDVELLLEALAIAAEEGI